MHPLTKIVAIVMLALPCGTTRVAATAERPRHDTQLVVTARRSVQLLSREGRPVQTIGGITVSGDRAIVIDGETNSLVVLSLAGQVLSRWSPTSGGGLAYPVQIASGKPGELLVLDAQYAELDRFLLNGDVVTFTAATALGLSGVSDLCAMSGQTFVAGRSQSDEVVHAVDEKGSVLEHFGEVSGAGDQFGKILFSRAKLLCLQRERLIVFTSQFGGATSAYGPRGDLRWRREAPGFRAASYQQSAPGKYEYVLPPDATWDSAVAVFQPAFGIVALQIAERRGLTAPVSTVRTILLSSSDGHLLGEQTDLPVIRAVSKGLLVSGDELGRVSFLDYSVVER